MPEATRRRKAWCRPGGGRGGRLHRFIQFWILPSVRGLETRVQQRQYRLEDRTDRWLQIMAQAAGLRRQ